MLTKYLKEQKAIGESSVMDMDFKGTPLEKEILFLKFDFINMVYSEKTQMEIIKYSYDSSIDDLNSLECYFKSNSSKIDETLIKVAKDTSFRIHSRAKNIQKYNNSLSKKNEEMIIKLRNLLKDQVEQRNNIIKMKKDYENLKTKKEFIQKELNRCLGFFKTIFSLFYDFKAGTKEKLREVDEKLKKMSDSMTESEMVLFIDKTERFEKSINQVNEMFSNYSTYIGLVETISKELLMINYESEPNIMNNITKAFKHLNNYQIVRK